MIHTALSILYTDECALLFVTWKTLPPVVTAIRVFLSDDQATPHTLMKCQNKTGQKSTHLTITLCSVHLFLRGNIGDAERLVVTTRCHPRAVGGNRAPLNLKTRSPSDQQLITQNKRTPSVCSSIFALVANGCDIAKRHSLYGSLRPRLAAVVVVGAQSKNHVTKLSSSRAHCSHRTGCKNASARFRASLCGIFSVQCKR